MKNLKTTLKVYSGSTSNAFSSIITQQEPARDTPEQSIPRSLTESGLHYEGFTFLGDEVLMGMPKKNTLRKETSDSEKLI